MNKDKLMFGTKWVSVYETKNGFHYLQRKGRDSIALFLTRLTPLNKIEVLIRLQPMPFDDGLALHPCPITGGLDNEDDYLSSDEIKKQVIVEAKEEAGYSLETTDVHLMTKYNVGTQTNESVHIFWADVTGKVPTAPQGDGSIFEAVSKNEWVQLRFLKTYDYVACQLGYYVLKQSVRTFYEEKLW